MLRDTTDSDLDAVPSSHHRNQSDNGRFWESRRSSEAMDLEYLRSSEIGQERKKYKIERQTSKLFAACASMLGSKLPVFS